MTAAVYFRCRPNVEDLDNRPLRLQPSCIPHSLQFGGNRKRRDPLTPQSGGPTRDEGRAGGKVVLQHVVTSFGASQTRFSLIGRAICHSWAGLQERSLPLKSGGEAGIQHLGRVWEGGVHSADAKLASDFSYNGLVFYLHDAAEHCRCFASDQNAKFSLMRVCCCRELNAWMNAALLDL